MKNVILMLSVLFINTVAFAHGEDKLGPNGGYVRMPGAFHTELVPVNSNKFKVYLLDIEWKNPTLTGAKVDIYLKGKPMKKATCEIKENYFLCNFPSKINMTKKGELKVIAEREGKIGAEVTYHLPFKLEAN
ncbi:MAG: hypothetical protein WA160_15035 [Pseudobdellovibrio sp.]